MNSSQKDFLVRIGSNRRLAAKKLEMDFKMPWDFLAKTEARAARFARGEVNSSSNSIMWCLLEKVRTHFEQNPDADF